MQQTIRDSSWVLALWAFAVTLPVYNLLARHPEFFIAHDLDGYRALAFVGLVSFGTPLAFIAIVLLARIGGARIQAATRMFLLALMAVVFGLGAGSKLATGWPALGIALVLAVLSMALVIRIRRRHQMPAFALYLLALGIPIWFLVMLAREGVVIPKPAEPGLVIRVKTEVPVVMLILDELPQTTLLNRNDSIDPVRFPNLAKFAATSTWYRNATTVGESTQVAIPAILSGELPNDKRPPIHSAYPHSLFTLLAGDYRIDAAEPYTRLCPDEICPGNRGAFTASLRSTLLDTSIVFAHIVVPDPWSKQLPPITQDWKGFWPDAAEPKGNDLKSRLHALAYQNHEQILRESLSDLQPSRRLLLFRHLALPHVPWRYTDSGDEYIGGPLDGISDEKWTDNQWLVAAAYQRHLLQTSYTDRLVGVLIERLKEAGLFDDAMIVIVADHGASFTPARYRRQLTPLNAAEIANIPLFIKYPKQRRSVVDQRRVQTIDILPTILNVLGAEFQGHLAGQDLKSKSFSEPEVRTIFKVSGSAIKLDESTLETDRARAKRLKYDVLTADDTKRQSWFAMGPFAKLVGAGAGNLWHGNSGFEMLLDNVDQYENVRFDGRPLPLRVRGVLVAAHGAQRERDIAIVINNTVAGVTKSIPFGTSQSLFSALIQPAYLLPGRNDIAIGTITQAERGIGLQRVESTAKRDLKLLRQSEQEFLVDQAGKKWPIVAANESAPLQGWLEHGQVQGDYIWISGWAVNLAAESLSEAVVITVDGVSVGTALTSVKRSDVAASLGNQRFLSSGFFLKIPKSVVPPFGKQTLEGYALGGGVAVKLRTTVEFPW